MQTESETEMLKIHGSYRVIGGFGQIAQFVTEMKTEVVRMQSRSILFHFMLFSGKKLAT